MTGPGSTHDHFRFLAAAAVDGRLDPAEAIELADHVRGCAPCRGFASLLAHDHALLAEPGSAAVPPERVRSAVVAAARRGGSMVAGSPRPTNGAERAMPLLFATAAVLIVAVGVVSLRALPDQPGPGAVATPTPATCAAPPEGLVGWWPGDGDLENLSGGDAASLHGGAGYAPGMIGEAFQFGGSGAFVEVPGRPVIDVGLNDFTVMAWVRFDSTVGEQVLVEDWIDADTAGTRAQGWTLTKLVDDSVRLHVASSAQYGRAADSLPDIFVAARWFHVAARREGTLISILVDGAIVATSDEPDRPVADLDAVTSLKFGRRGDSRGYFLDGRLDEIQLFVGRALSDDEIAEVVAAGAAGVCHPGL